MSLIPDDLNANGNPFRQPRAFAVSGVEAALYPKIATVSQTVLVGSLIQARADGSAVLADSSSGIKANGVCVRVLSAENKIIWSEIAMIRMDLPDGTATSGYLELWLGEDGAIANVPSDTGLIQRVGVAIDYDPTTEKHRCNFTFDPGSGLL